MSLKRTYKRIPLGENEQVWLRRRKVTTYIAIVFGFLLGMEYSGMINSLPFYLKYTVHDGNAKLHYSVIMTAMSFSSAISGIFFGTFIDKSRNLRLCLLIFTCLGLIGNVLYSLQYSVWLLLLGRLVCGLSDGAQPAISGEFSRLYRDDELIWVLGRYQVVYSIGFVIGPATAVWFKPIHLTIGTWVLDENNFIGIFLASLMAIYILVVLIGVSNLSQLETVDDDEDSNTSSSKSLKKNTVASSKISLQDILGSVTNLHKLKDFDTLSINEDKEISYKYLKEDAYYSSDDNAPAAVDSRIEEDPVMSLKDILKNVSIMLLIVSSAMSSALASSIALLVNMVASISYNWTMLHLGVVTSICAGIYALVMLPFGSSLIGNGRRIYYFYIMCFILPCVAMVLLMFSKSFVSQNGSSVAVETVTIAVIVLVNLFTGISAPIFARRLLFQLVPEHKASFAEGVRYMFSKVIELFGFFTAAFIFPKMEICMPIMIIVFLIMAIILVLRRNQF